MPFITQELLRKRAEHNEGRLMDLEEVSLHQQELEKIEHLDLLCRHLKILYLQNNIIERMENLHKLKELEYLNLALNNVSMIEDVDGCESLRKLDLTLNFVDGEDLERSLDCLEHCPSLRELHMTGNPCMDWQHARNYILARAPQL
jgi:protein TilB